MVTSAVVPAGPGPLVFWWQLCDIHMMQICRMQELRDHGGIHQDLKRNLGKLGIDSLKIRYRAESKCVNVNCEAVVPQTAKT